MNVMMYKRANVQVYNPDKRCTIHIFTDVYHDGTCTQMLYSYNSMKILCVF
jgi:hypothetical protein